MCLNIRRGPHLLAKAQIALKRKPVVSTEKSAHLQNELAAILRGKIKNMKLRLNHCCNCFLLCLACIRLV